MNLRKINCMTWGTCSQPVTLPKARLTSAKRRPKTWSKLKNSSNNTSPNIGCTISLWRYLFGFRINSQINLPSNETLAARESRMPKQPAYLGLMIFFQLTNFQEWFNDLLQIIDLHTWSIVLQTLCEIQNDCIVRICRNRSKHKLSKTNMPCPIQWLVLPRTKISVILAACLIPRMSNK